MIKSIKSYFGWRSPEFKKIQDILHSISYSEWVKSGKLKFKDYEIHISYAMYGDGLLYLSWKGEDISISKRERIVLYKELIKMKNIDEDAAKEKINQKFIDEAISWKEPEFPELRYISEGGMFSTVNRQRENE